MKGVIAHLGGRVTRRIRWSATAIGALIAALVPVAAGAAPQHVTITVWYEAQAPGYTPSFNAWAADFAKLHPGVTVVPVGKATTALATQVPLALETSSGPDVVEAWDPGFGVLGRLVKAHEIVSLNSYAAKYGWLKRGIGMLNEQEYTPDGATWGSGNLYALPFNAGALGIFYNKAKLAALGLGAPKTFQQFLNDVQLAKKAGQVPIMLGSAQGFPLLHDFDLVRDAYQPSATVTRNWTFGVGHGKLTFVTSGNLKAADIIAAWGKNGDFNSDYSGTQLLDMVNRFGKSEGVFMITGTWFAAAVQQLLGANAGFVVLPGRNGALITDGDPTGLAIAAHSAHQDVDAAFLNFLQSPSAVKTYIKNGGMPALPVSPAFAGAKPGSAVADAFLAYGQLVKANGMSPVINAASPSMLQTADGALEELASGKISPSAFLSTIQSDYKTYWSSQG